jgi:light-harvesting complex II chlorophyll a/b binding protein 3
LDRSYPGFDPLSLTNDDTKLKEIKNGRLAMIGMLGLEIQNHVTGQSPIANLAAHWDAPLQANIFTSGVAMFATSGSKERPLWFVGAHSPSYLTGEFPGDRGFDPFGLAADPKTYARMRVSEIFHGRLAMLAVLGAIAQEASGKGPWYTGADEADMGLQQMATYILISGIPEALRGQAADDKKNYPGFDPLNLTSDYTKEAEIKNGRLALVAIAGFWAQYKLTGQSPISNLVDHWKHPLANNIAATLANPPVAMFATSGRKDGVWFPGATPPAHLTGEYPADRGFDPLGLAYDKDVYARMRVSEVFHGRLAMTGMLAAIVPEILGKGAWYEQDDLKIGIIVMAIAAPTEYWRGQGGFGWDKGTLDRSYPGFDPAKLTTDYTKAAEIKNGRLAMAGIAGLFVQHAVTGASPLADIATHIANPLGANIIANLS